MLWGESAKETSPTNAASANVTTGQNSESGEQSGSASNQSVSQNNEGKLRFSSISPSGIQTEPNRASASVTTSETDNNPGVSEDKNNITPANKQAKSENKPKLRYSLSVDKETGVTTLIREDVSGAIPVVDGSFNVTAKSPEEMLGILSNPQNGMKDILDEVGVSLENQIKTRNLDRIVKENDGLKIKDVEIISGVDKWDKTAKNHIKMFLERGAKEDKIGRSYDKL